MNRLTRSQKQRLIAEAIVESRLMRLQHKVLAKATSKPKKFTHPQSFTGSMARTVAKAAVGGAIRGATQTSAPEWQTQTAGATFGALGAAASEAKRRLRQARIAQQIHRNIQRRRQAASSTDQTRPATQPVPA